LDRPVVRVVGVEAVHGVLGRFDEVHDVHGFVVVLQ
jgi:hypothetical protein